MAWMKANLAIVVLSAVIILSLPAALVGSQMWNAKIKKSRQTAATKAMSDLDALKITYIMPSVVPGDPGKPLPLPVPNPVATEHFRKHRQELEKQIGQVVTVATEINSQGHKPLLDGLFPTPQSSLKALELADLLVGKGGKPSIYQDLLKSINAGGPADPVRVADALREIQFQFNEKVRSDSNREKLLPTEEAELTKKLVEARIGQYQLRARDISVYAGPECLPPEIPRVAPPEPPTATTCYEWQYDYWVISDLLHAVDSANGGPGARTPVEQSAVKKIEKIMLDPPIGGSYATITNRRTSAENTFYDVRNAHLTLIVSSAKLPEVLNAFSRTNLMTVTGLSFREVNAWADLEQGFYYGPEHVVRADLDVETVWLRSWTESLMPDGFKTALLGTTNPDEAGGAPPPMAPRGSGGKGNVVPGGRGDMLEGAPPPPPRPKAKSTKKPSTKKGGDGGF